jgi:hypothetical protein
MCATTCHTEPNRPPIVYPSLPRASKQSKGDDKQVALIHAHARKKPKNEIKPGRANKLRSEAAGEENGSNEQSNRLSIQIIARPRKREIGERQ